MNYTGDKISLLRKKQKMSQEKLAEIIGVSRQTIYKWEYGIVIPSEENIKSLCEVFSVENSYFYPEAQDEIAIAVATPKSKKTLIIFSVILGILFVAGVAISVSLGIIAFTPNEGFLAINNRNINKQHFIVSLVLTIMLLVAEIIITSMIFVKKCRRKPNVNPM